MDRNREADSEWTRVVVAAVALFVATLVPAKRRDPPRPTPYGLDKIAHSVGHASFAAALFDAFSSTGHRRPVAAAVLVSSGYGVALELLQRWIPGRRFEYGDVLAGTLGSVLGVSGARLWRAVPRE